VIHWTFVFTRIDGRSFRMEELALQRWRGDRVAEERFFYDPEQTRRLS
jgi:ketosteroid isomerase-like protein